MSAMLWPPAPPGKGESARLRLLEAAVDVFGEQGPKAASVREIVRRAGQNVASIAYHFGGKDQLYLSVLQGVAHTLRHTLGDKIAEIQAAQARGHLNSEEALQLLLSFLSAFYLRILSRTEVMRFGRLIIREQTQPGPGFEILYDQVFRNLHEMLCGLVGAVIGADPRDCDTIVRTHSVMGQVWFFAVARETILRRTGWSSLEGQNAEAVVKVLWENIETLLLGLKKRKRRPL